MGLFFFLITSLLPFRAMLFCEPGLALREPWALQRALKWKD